MAVRRCTIFVAIILIMTAVAAGAQSTVLLREEFKDLKNWDPLYFPKIAKHTTYTAVAEGKRTMLRTQSAASASAIVFKRTFNPYQYPRLRWRWKVDQIFPSADGRTKAGDDYPLRVYVIFQYDPEKAGLSDKLVFGAMKAVYGKYPPDSTLNYVWAGSPAAADTITSPYTDRVRIIARQKGPAKVGQWVEETAHIIDDYRKAFGKNPPETASIAVMNDSDNTGEAAISYVEFIEISN